MARYDLGLSWEEFGECTPGMFQALCKRRNTRLKYERFANAQVAAAVYNMAGRMRSDDAPEVTAFDFVMDEEESAKRENDIKFRRYVQKAIGQLPISASLEKLREKRLKVIEDLRASGCGEPEAFFDSIWPHLKPKESECQK